MDAPAFIDVYECVCVCVAQSICGELVSSPVTVHMLEGSCPQDLSFTETTAAAPFRERERGKACFHCPLPWTLDHF